MSAANNIFRIIDYHSVMFNFSGNSDVSQCQIIAKDQDSIRVEDDLTPYGRTHNLAVRFFTHEKRPWAMINGDSPLFGLYRATNSERDRILDQGLVVYMYEPLFIHRSSGQFFYELYQKSEGPLPAELLNELYCVELDSVLEFMRMNSLENAKVTVHLCDVGLEEVLEKIPRYRDLNFLTMDIYLICEAAFRQAHKEDLKFSDHFVRKFACLNYRYDAFRETVVAYLRQKQLHEQSHISYYHLHNPQVFRDHAPLSLEKMPSWPVIQDGIAAMQSELPYTVGHHVKNPVAVNPWPHRIPHSLAGANIMDTTSTLSIYSSSFLAIANETRFFHRHGILTEKTTAPMAAFRPFLLIGSPGLLKQLHELGFKTFSDFWEESYDQVEDPGERLEQVFAIVEKLAALKSWQIREMLFAMKPVLNHNFKHLTETFLDSQIRRLSQ